MTDQKVSRFSFQPGSPMSRIEPQPMDYIETFVANGRSECYLNTTRNSEWACLQHLLHYRDYDDDFLQHIVVAETRCHHIQLEVKSVSMQWKHPDSPSPKKFKVQQPAEKVMLTAFFDMQGLLLLELKSAGCLDKCPTVQPNT
ncbi:hypothetical protein TNCV_652932 [Trichonephila clavipes]|nr:hypothetical protein TNCV_652932 [Trichonephila clavipes]